MFELSGITKTEKTDFDLRPQGRAGALAQLKVGDRLAAKVLRLAGEQQVYLDFGSYRVLAFTDEAVPIGQTLQLKVVQTGPSIHLRIIPESVQPDRLEVPPPAQASTWTVPDHSAFIRLLERMIAHKDQTPGAWQAPPDIMQTLVQLRHLLEPASLGNSSHDIMLWLQEAVEDQGLLFEKKLVDSVAAAFKAGEPAQAQQVQPPHAEPTDAARQLVVVKDGLAGKPLANDLKALLLKLKSYLDGSQTADEFNPKQSKTLYQSVDQLLGYLENQQERLIQRHLQAHLFQVFSHWLPLKDQQPLRLKIYYPKKAPTNLPLKVCLCLYMDQLGPVRADLTLLERHLLIALSVTTPAAVQALKADMAAIAIALKGMFSDVQATVHLSVAAIVDFDKEDSTDAQSGKIDIQV